MGDSINSNQEVLGGILKRLRKEKGFTQQQLADRMGLDRSTYTKYETCRKPDLDTTIQLAAFYNLSVDEFLGEYPETVVKGYKMKPVLVAASPENNDTSALSEDEKKLLSLFKKSIRKTEIMNFVRSIADEDGEVSSEITE